jgi:WD40 repeat protein
VLSKGSIGTKPRTADDDGIERRRVGTGGSLRGVWIALAVAALLLTGMGVTLANGFAESAYLRSTFTGHYAAITKLEWSPDDKRIASASLDNTVRLWDVATGRVQTNIKLQGLATGVTWSPDGSRVAALGRIAQVFPLQSGKSARTLEWAIMPNRDIAWSPDGTRIAGASRQSINIWDAANDVPLPLIILPDHMGTVNSVDWTLDSLRLASAGEDNTVRIWNANGIGDRVMLAHPDEGGSITSVAWSPDGTQVVSGAAGGQIYIWNVERKELVHTLIGHGDTVNSVDWSPDGNKVASGSSDNSVKVWDARSGEMLLTLSGHVWDQAPVSWIEWSHDGKTIAAATGARIRMWNIDMPKTK